MPAKLTRPFHFLVPALRALDPTVGTGATTATCQLTAMRQPRFFWLTPEGCPDAVEFWAGDLLTVDWPGLAREQLESGQDLRVTLDHRDILAEIVSKRLGNPNLATVFPDYTPTLRGVVR